jgi:hypothetical protein
MWAFLWGSIWMVFTPVTFGNNWPYHLFYLWVLYFALWCVQVFTSIFAESFRVGDLTGVARGLRVYFGITRAPWLTYLIISLVSSLPWLRSFLMLTPFLYLACLLWSEYVFNKAIRAQGLAREGELHTAGQVNAGRAGNSDRKQQWAWVVGRQAMTGNDAAPDFTTVKRPARAANVDLFDDDLEPVPATTRDGTPPAKNQADASTVAASVIAFLSAK